MLPDEILHLVPQQPPFRFVEKILSVDAETIEGTYQFKPDEFFYAGHFPTDPVTPGVILVECMAQIGLVGLGIYLLSQSGAETPSGIAFTGSDVAFLRPVYPGERVRVIAEKVYFRLGKLKVQARMYDSSDTLVCKGSLSGMGRRSHKD